MLFAGWRGGAEDDVLTLTTGDGGVSTVTVTALLPPVLDAVDGGAELSIGALELSIVLPGADGGIAVRAGGRSALQLDPANATRMTTSAVTDVHTSFGQVQLDDATRAALTQVATSVTQTILSSAPLAFGSAPAPTPLYAGATSGTLTLKPVTVQISPTAITATGPLAAP